MFFFYNLHQPENEEGTVSNCQVFTLSGMQETLIDVTSVEIDLKWVTYTFSV